MTLLIAYVIGIVPSAVLLTALTVISSRYRSDGSRAAWDDKARLKWVRDGIPLMWFAATLWPVIVPVLLCYYMSKKVIQKVEESYDAKR